MNELFDEAASLAKRGEMDAAFRIYDGVLRARPRSAKARRGKMLALWALGLRAAAFQEFEKLVELWPNYRLAYVNIAALLSSAGWPCGAIQVYRRALRRVGVDAVLLNDLGVTYVEAGRLREAARCLSFAAKRFPTDDDIVHNLGNVYLEMDQPVLAARCYARALRLNPGDTFGYVELADCMYELERFGKAEKLYRRYWGFHKDSYVLNRIGICYARQLRFQEAIPWYRRAIEVDPLSPSPWYNLGLAFERCGRLGEAIEAYQQALRLKSDDGETGGRQVFAWTAVIR